MKRLLIAAAVLAALSGAIWWSEKQEAAKEGQADPKAPPKILAIKDADLTKIEIQKRDQPATVLTKGSDGKWAITAPVQLASDNAPVSAITAAVASLASDRVVDENLTDLAAYGLEPPVVSVTFTTKDGKTQRLRVGEDTPDKTGVYASVDGGKRLFTIASFQKSTFDKSTADLRDKHLLSFDSEQVSRVELNVSGKQPLEFSRTGTQWQIFKPRPMRADALQVDELVRILHDAEMDISMDEKASTAAFASAKPVAVAKVTTPNGLQTFEVRKSGDDYFAKSSVVPGAFKTTPNVGPGVSKAFEDFQNKKLFDFGFDDPTKITYKSKDEDRTFEKSGMNWVMNGRTMDSISVQNMIDKVRELSATSITAGTVAKPEIEIGVVSKDGTRSEKILIAPSGMDFLAQRENEAGVYRIAGSTLSDLQQAVKGVQEAAADKKSDNKK